ncbi:Mu DNA-binding protein [Blastomonas natatoria]|uniref:Mu DNA-binding protein n=1 Tax=Blastomonas natatoria TaxID=34015 RepID=A0A2V3VB28_9SPHN|nr:DNA-binding protein [Blastomonas natatoria]PXW79012.1 Mu DNA-binding protein [Blastomonas natatoria]
MIQSGTKTWFTAAELAELALPGLPRIKRKVNERAADERWALAVDSRGAPLARPRAGRGGGLEYSIRILPAIARAELVRRGISIDGQVHASPDDASGIAASQLWSWYEAQNAKTRAEAERRLDAVQRIERYEAAGVTRSMAVMRS